MNSRKTQFMILVKFFRPKYCLTINSIIVKRSDFFIFLYLGFLSHRLTIYRTVGEGSGYLNSSLLLPYAHEHSDIYLQVSSWNDYRVFLILVHVITRMLPDKIEPPLGISIILNVNCICMMLILMLHLAD